MSSSIQPDCILWVCFCLSQGQHCPLQYPALLPAPAPQAEAIHPLTASLPALLSFCSDLPRKSTPAFQYFKGPFGSVHIIQYFCCVGVSGAYSPVRVSQSSCRRRRHTDVWILRLWHRVLDFTGCPFQIGY